MIRKGQPKRFRESGGATSAVANSMPRKKTRIKLNRASFSTSKPKLSKNTTEVIIVESTNTISTPERVTCSMLRLRMKKLGSNWRNSLEKLHWKKQSCRSKQRGRSSTSLHLTCITWHQRKQSQAFTILHTRS